MVFSSSKTSTDARIGTGLTLSRHKPYQVANFKPAVELPSSPTVFLDDNVIICPQNSEVSVKPRRMVRRTDKAHSIYSNLYHSYPNARALAFDFGYT